MSRIPHICLTCQTVFPTLGFLGLHCAFLRHNPNRFCCIPCGLSFPDRINLAQHSNAHSMDIVQATIRAARMAAPHHQPEGQDGGYRSAQPTDGASPSEPSGGDLQPIECDNCEKRFKTESALNAHLSNPLSHQLRTMGCPIQDCECKFKSGSGIAHHVENGKVHQNITRKDVTKAVKALDTNGNISIRRIEPSTTTPSSSFTYSATEAAFDGHRYTCFLCGKSRFKTLLALNSHLNSPAHDANEFKCPMCQKEFKVVSALAQHVEAGGCANRRVTGVDGTNAQDVERYIDSLTSKFTPQNRIQM